MSLKNCSKPAPCRCNAASALIFRARIMAVGFSDNAGSSMIIKCIARKGIDFFRRVGRQVVADFYDGGARAIDGVGESGNFVFDFVIGDAESVISSPARWMIRAVPMAMPLPIPLAWSVNTIRLRRSNPRTAGKPLPPRLRHRCRAPPKSIRFLASPPTSSRP